MLRCIFSRQAILSGWALVLAAVSSGPARVHGYEEPGAPPRSEAAQQQQQISPESIGWQLSATDDGVRIERIQTNSVAAKAKLQEGDIILKIGDENIRNPERIGEVLSSLKDEPNVTVVVEREGEELSYLLPLAEIQTGASTAPGTSQRAAPADLAEQVRQLQEQVQQQQVLLDSLIAEVRALRGQRGAARPTEVDQEFEGEVETPITQPGTPITQPGRTTGGGVVAPLGGNR